jgi:hypothetical protein
MLFTRSPSASLIPKSCQLLCQPPNIIDRQRPCVMSHCRWTRLMRDRPSITWNNHANLFGSPITRLPSARYKYIAPTTVLRSFHPFSLSPYLAARRLLLSQAPPSPSLDSPGRPVPLQEGTTEAQMREMPRRGWITYEMRRKGKR